MGARIRMLALLMVFMVTGCATTTAKPATPTSTATPVTPAVRVTSARVTRITGFSNNHTPAFEATISDPVKAQRLYDAVLALPVTPANSAPGCLMDVAVAYRITFYDGAAMELMAWVKPDGCRNAKVGGSSVIHDTTSQFWQTFASSLGVSQETLFDLAPHSTGPHAPTPGDIDWVGN